MLRTVKRAAQYMINPLMKKKNSMQMGGWGKIRKWSHYNPCEYAKCIITCTFKEKNS